MIYIKRSAEGSIANIYFSPADGLEEVNLFDPELKMFLDNAQNDALVKKILEKLDLDMVRVIEDMLDLMMAKNLIRFTDLPLPVQNKLLFKRSVRQSLGFNANFISEEETLNF
ncbi:hypothetical protein [Thiosulfativibrio zosterae]|uniref:Tryptophan synthase subunit beta like protein n=1 Tax=Thiosulfativibrio zosterae TaxID=2675053 RepID=A0A6F8PJN5_9GAMM|nr:hypothetical protein [Thiosulfativibrio zosterae]BBP42309.1 hypothetical protein THMIRHAT_00550 [Thiosulfativibrio zosterae]